MENGEWRVEGGGGGGIEKKRKSRLSVFVAKNSRTSRLKPVDGRTFPLEFLSSFNP